jgi:hypothetical protein
MHDVIFETFGILFIYYLLFLGQEVLVDEHVSPSKLKEKPH